MKGSITFKFSGEPSDGSVRILREGDLDSGDLEVIATLVAEDLMLNRLIASGEIKPTLLDPTGVGQFHDHWSN